jgi:Amt family ammonium transporter
MRSLSARAIPLGRNLLFSFGALLMISGLAAAQPVSPDALASAVEALRADQQRHADFTWLMTCARLVLLMQIGFMMLESGATRAKNSINVAMKNFCDMLISIPLFAMVGFSLMFGVSQFGLFGWNKQHLLNSFQDPWVYALFAFQAMFLGTAATIVSGAVAERMMLKSYLLITTLMAAIIYPVFGHWTWGNLLEDDNTAWLADLGFMDFAGSTVVHATGGWLALIAIWMLGPRRDKYNSHGVPQQMHGHSMVLTTAGALVLFIGWLGFNGGSSLTASADIGQIVINTVLAGTVGGIAATILGRLRDGVFLPTRSVNGLLGGLVAVTAGANVVTPLGAAAIGLLAASLLVWSMDLLEKRLRLDDVVGAVSVHGVCGAFGTLAVAIFATESALATGGRLSQLAVQSTGVLVNFLWVAAIAIPGIWLIKRLVGLRVSDANEAAGLNIAEHGASMGTYALQEHLAAIAHGRADLATRLDETTGDKAADLAVILNPFLDKVQHLVGGVSETSGRLASELHHVADEVSQSATVINVHTGTVQTASEKVAQSAQSASDNAKDLRRKGAELAGVAGTVSTDIRQIAAFVENLSGAVSTVARDAQRASDVSAQAVDLSQTASQTVSQLGTAADEIEAVVDLIIGIQSQTNLLALNATIEAARAGEQGRGFAIVAGEIKALSERTAGATEDIRNAVLKVRDSSLGSRDMIGEVGTILHTIATAVADIHHTAEREQGNMLAVNANVGDAAQRIDTLSDAVNQFHQQSQTVEKAISNAISQAGTAQAAVTDLRDQASKSMETARTVSASSHEMEGVAVGLSYRAGTMQEG